jgi:endonuclease/exonuclease/phosphatase family metal-dependent hydrolase
MAEETGVETVIRGLESAGPIAQADVYLLQEVLHSGDGDRSLPAQLAKRLRLSAAFAPGDELPGGVARGVAILSRFAIRDPQIQRLKRFDLRFKSRCRVALALTVASPRGPIRVVNVHLDSRINADERLEQLKPIVARLPSGSGPQLIGGDFNTSNVFWVRRWLPLPFVSSQGARVSNYLESEGFSTPFTVTGRTFSYLPLRLDWIFVRELRPLDAGVEPIGFSDHRGLWLKLPAT